MRIRTTFVITLLSASLLVACLEETKQPLLPLDIERIEVSEQPIEPDKPLPEFKTHFGTGANVIYTYVWLRNADTMTGSFPVRMTWFSPSDLAPPIARRDIELEPGQSVAQFSIHNENGMQRGPYKLIGRAGKNLSELTASGSKRFFVGMTLEEADEYVRQEEEFIRQRDEERAKREAERKKEKEEEARLKALNSTGSTMSGADLGTGALLPTLPLVDNEDSENPEELENQEVPSELTD